MGRIWRRNGEINRKDSIEWAESGGEMEKPKERIHRMGRIWRRNGETKRKIP